LTTFAPLLFVDKQCLHDTSEKNLHDSSHAQSSQSKRATSLLLINAAVHCPTPYVWNWKPTQTASLMVLRRSAGHHGLALLADIRSFRIGNVTHTVNANMLSLSMLKKFTEQPATRGHRVEIRAVQLA
jgi:hypothetical protein